MSLYFPVTGGATPQGRRRYQRSEFPTTSEFITELPTHTSLGRDFVKIEFDWNGTNKNQLELNGSSVVSGASVLPWHLATISSKTLAT